MLAAAVSGQLTEQRASDGNAAALLKKIFAEKAAAPAAKNVAKKSSRENAELAPAPVPDDKIPFPIPANWTWCRLGDFVKSSAGNSKLIKGKLSSTPFKGSFPGFSASGQDVFLDFYEHDEDAIIVSAVGARCGKTFIARGKWCAIANTNFVIPDKRVLDLDFLQLVLNDEKWWLRGGSAQPFVKVKASLNRPFPLPPLAEQRRIVERVEKILRALLPLSESVAN